MIVGEWVKSKGIQFLLILFLGVSIIRVLPIIRFYLGGWHSLVTLDSLDLIEVNKTNGDLWGIGNHLYRYEPQLGNVILWGKQIDLPPGYWIEHPIRFCPSQQVWVVYRDKMISYDPVSEHWNTEHPELESIGQPIDCFYVNDKIAILGEKAIIHQDGKVWNEISLPPHDENKGKGILQSNNGEWVLQIGASFYRLNEQSSDWETITSYAMPIDYEITSFSDLLYSNDNYYWLGINFDSIGRIHINENAEQMEILDDISFERGYSLRANEDNFGRVWLALDNEAWIFEDGEFTHFLLPYSLNFVQDIAVDPEREIIYFLGSKSITYRSTSYNP